MKTGLLVFLFVVGTLAFKQVWSDSSRSTRAKCLNAALAVACWVAMAAVGYGTP